MTATICRLDKGNKHMNTSCVKFRALLSLITLVAVTSGAVRARAQQPAAPLQAARPPVRLSPSEIEAYKRARTLMDWTPSQIRDSPFLHKLRPAGSQEPLPMILKRVGQTGSLLFQDFPQVSCDETVLSEVGSPPKTRNQKFRYIVIPRPVGDVRILEEYRTDPQGKAPEKSNFGDLYMLTSGFASTWLYLSPAEQHDSRFRYFGTQTIRNRECYVVGFAQDPERARRVAEFLLEGSSTAVLVQGLAWIETQSFQVLRITTWLLAPRMEIRLGSETSTVDFSAVQPSGADKVLWLPSDVEVEVFYRSLEVRNTHHYSNFKLFRVESKIKPTG